MTSHQPNAQRQQMLQRPQRRHRRAHRVHRLAQAAMLLCAALATSAARAQVAADPGAAAGNRPLVQAASNGVPVVNIAQPNTAGVSHNRYGSFNVGAAGVVLNNSLLSASGATPPAATAPTSPVTPPPTLPREPGCGTVQVCNLLGIGTKARVDSIYGAASVVAPSVLVGGIAANPQLGGSSARLIVNEVVGGSASSLAGRIEVFGQAADVVIANPWGLTCNGCGFIGVQRASLVSGTPLWNGTALGGFSVSGGYVGIGAAGLAGPTLSSLDLIGGALTVHGPVMLDAAGSSVHALAGANRVDWTTLATTPQARSGVVPSTAVQVGSAGGLYADQIFVLSNEQGVGVSLAGTLQARNGALTLDANGHLRLAAIATAANGSLVASSNGTLGRQRRHAASQPAGAAAGWDRTQPHRHPRLGGRSDAGRRVGLRRQRQWTAGQGTA